MWSRHKTRTGWAVLLTLALVVRLIAYALITDYRQPWQLEGEVMASALVERGVLAYDFYGLTPLLPTAFLPPVYPLVLAAVYALSGSDSLPVVRLVQILLSTASVGLLVVLARAMTDSRRIGWIAGALASVYPAFVAGVVQIGTATLEVLEAEILVWALLQWQRRSTWRWLATAGVMLGLLALTRGPALLLWPVVGVWLLAVVPNLSLRRRIAMLALFSACLAATLVPWTLRNVSAVGAPVLLATNSGLNFWIGHNPAATGEYAWPLETDLDLARQAAQLTEPARDAFYLRLGLGYLRSHPAEEVQLGLRKLWYFVWFRSSLGSSYPNAGTLGAIAEIVMMLAYGFVMLGVPLGIWLARRNWRQLFLFYGLWGIYAASSVAFFAATRFRAPVEPFLIVFAAVSLGWVERRADQVRHRQRSRMLGCPSC